MAQAPRKHTSTQQPLAERLRPKSLGEVIGQQHLLGAVLEIVDSFGQRSVMSFANLRVNTPLEPATFQFKPPVGADLIQQ